MEFVGKLHGVDIHLPLQRSEIRNVIAQKQKIADYKVGRHSMSLFQAYNDLQDIDDEFMKEHFTHDEPNAIRFMELMTEEMNAVSNQLQVDTVKQIEIDNEFYGFISWIAGAIILIITFFLLFHK